MPRLPIELKVGVISAGAFGSAFAKISAELGYQTTLYFNNQDQLNEFRSTRISNRLPGIRLPESIIATRFMAEATSGQDVVFVAVPSATMTEVFDRMNPLIGDRTMLVIGTKGLVEGTKGTNSTISSFILGKQPDLVDQVAVMSGPNKARELALGRETGTVMASYNPDRAASLQRWFSTPYFRIYTDDDVVGVEAGGALKNIFAFGIGIAQGLAVAGDTEALYFTRALEEMKRLGMALGAGSEATFDGLSGLGDLYLSCIGDGTRNSRAGRDFARGKTVEQIRSSGVLIESLDTVRRVYSFVLERGIDAPIVTGLYRGLYEGLSIQDGIQQLMGRKLTREHSRLYSNF